MRNETGRLDASVKFSAAYSVRHLFSGNFSPGLKKESYAKSRYQGLFLDFSGLVK